MDGVFCDASFHEGRPLTVGVVLVRDGKPVQIDTAIVMADSVREAERAAIVYAKFLHDCEVFNDNADACAAEGATQISRGDNTLAHNAARRRYREEWRRLNPMEAVATETKNLAEPRKKIKKQFRFRGRGVIAPDLKRFVPMNF